MGYTFNGYRRPDGQVGIRNYVGIIPSVTCASDVASAICRQVQGCVTFPHHQGCCQMPPDLERVTDTLISLGKSPNLGAVLIVSLGCEGIKRSLPQANTLKLSVFRNLAVSPTPSRKVPISPGIWP